MTEEKIKNNGFIIKVYDIKDAPERAVFLYQKIERNGIIYLSVPTYDILKPNEKVAYFYKVLEK